MCTDVDFWEHDFECCSCTVLYIFYTIKEKSVGFLHDFAEFFLCIVGVLFLLLLFIYLFFFFFFSGEETLK